MTDAFPLSWPDGWPRTPPAQQVDGRTRFAKGRIGYVGNQWQGKKDLTFGQARDGLLASAAKAGCRSLVLSTNFQLNASGLPSKNRGRPGDEGVAIYFTRGGRPMVMARDAYFRAEENMRSLGLALEAMAQLERHGGAGLAGRAFAGFAALPAPRKPHEILGCAANAAAAEIRAAWKRKIADAHPDQGGGHIEAAEINAARDIMLKALANG